MIHVFILTNTKWRETVKILEDIHLPYIVRHMKKKPFTYEEFKAIMNMTADGFDDILTTRGTMYERLQEQGIHFEALPMHKAYELIVQYPSLLKLPIVTDFETRIGAGVGGARLFRPRTEKNKERIEIMARAKDLSRSRKEVDAVAQSSRS